MVSSYRCLYYIVNDLKKKKYNFEIYKFGNLKKKIFSGAKKILKNNNKFFIYRQSWWKGCINDPATQP